MKPALQNLWEDLAPAEYTCPAPRPHAVAQRVNAALDAVPLERKRHMKQKLRTATILVAAILALTGSAFAVAKNWTVLDAFFGGSTEVGQELMNPHPYSVRDNNYILTVSSSVADGSSAYVVLTVEAQTTEAAKALMDPEFENMDTWSVQFPGQDDASSLISYSTSEAVELRTVTSRTWSMELHLGTTPETVSIRLGAMQKGLWLEVPFTPASSVTVEIHQNGTGAGTLEHAAGGKVTLETVTLTPLGITLEYAYTDGVQSRPVPAFLGTDGTLYSWSQLVSYASKGGSSDQSNGTVVMSADYTFRTVQDLTRLEAIVFEGTAYPLSGGGPYAMDTNSLPQPFQLPLIDRLNEGLGYAVPVRDLCEGLGGTCTWDAASHSTTLMFRDTTIVLTAGKSTALVNGSEVALLSAPILRDGVLISDCEIFVDAWCLDMYAAMENRSADLTNRVAWVVIP